MKINANIAVSVLSTVTYGILTVMGVKDCVNKIGNTPKSEPNGKKKNLQLVYQFS